MEEAAEAAVAAAEELLHLAAGEEDSAAGGPWGLLAMPASPWRRAQVQAASSEAALAIDTGKAIGVSRMLRKYECYWAKFATHLGLGRALVTTSGSCSEKGRRKQQVEERGREGKERKRSEV